MISLIRERFENKSVVILGFGREGQSTYALLRNVFPGKKLAVADLSESVRANALLEHDTLIHFITGNDYLDHIKNYDVIFRSPGIPVWMLTSPGHEMVDEANGRDGTCLIPRDKITSQTELFLECYARQVIGITGTKGKSTTSCLILHILQLAGRDVLLAGNIGNPVFHFIDCIKPETVVVFELSSHQLEFIKTAPHIAVVLNFFQEHLDAYESYDAYKSAKLNILRFQDKDDFVVYNSDDEQVKNSVAPFLNNRQPFPFSLSVQPHPGTFVRDGCVVFDTNGSEFCVWKIHQDRFLRGEHNLKNIMAAITVAMILGVDSEHIEDGIGTFKGLEHRLEYVGEFGRIHFYNDSIATIPEACIEAIKAIPGVDTLIAGGFDRGIEYIGLAEFLSRSEVRNIILIGAAGKRIMEDLILIGHTGKKLFAVNRFDDFKPIAFRETRAGYVCLLSPAAASYDEFRNFEERGKRFRELVSSELPK